MPTSANPRTRSASRSLTCWCILGWWTSSTTSDSNGGTITWRCGLGWDRAVMRAISDYILVTYWRRFEMLGIRGVSKYPSYHLVMWARILIFPTKAGHHCNVGDYQHKWELCAGVARRPWASRRMWGRIRAWYGRYSYPEMKVEILKLSV